MQPQLWQVAAVILMLCAPLALWALPPSNGESIPVVSVRASANWKYVAPWCDDFGSFAEVLQTIFPQVLSGCMSAGSWQGPKSKESLCKVPPNRLRCDTRVA